MDHMKGILEVLRAMQYPRRFWLIWLASTSSALAYTWFVLKPTALSELNTLTTTVSGLQPDAQSGKRLTTLMILFLSAFLATYVAAILIWVDFADYDDSMLVLTTLKGHAMGLAIWHDSGRFWPFYLTEFNLLKNLSNSVYIYYAFPIIGLLIISLILLIFDTDLDLCARSTILAFALLTPSLLITLSMLVVEERTVLVFFLIVLLSAHYFERTHSVIWALSAVIFAQLMLYYKETSFLLLLGFAAGRLFLRLLREHRGLWNRGALRDSSSRLDFCLVFLSLSFLLCYFVVMGSHRNFNYANQRSHPIEELLVLYLEVDLLVWLFVGVALYRGYLILRRRVSPSLVWDGIGIGGVAFILGYQYLHLFSSSYMAPVDVLAILYLGHFVSLWWMTTQPWRRIALGCLAVTIILQNLLFFTIILYERKNLIHAKHEIASLIVDRYRRQPEHVIRLYFPFANPYVVGEFAYYLTYRGVPLDHIVLGTKMMTKDGPCIEHRSVSCRAVVMPSIKDLVIVFPEDEASLAEACVFRSHGELFSYKPWPRMPQSLYSVVGSIPLAGGGATFKPQARPDRWMDASVTEWK